MSALTDMRGHFSVTLQKLWSHHSTRHSQKPHATCKLHGWKFHIAGIGICDIFAPVTLTLTRWPLLVCTDQKWSCCVKAFESYRLTPKLFTTPLHGWQDTCVQSFAWM